MAQWASLISQDDVITSGRTRWKGRLSESELVSLQYHINSSKKRKKKVGGRVKQGEKNKRRPMMLTVLGCPPWTVSKEKTPQSGLIRKGTDTHNMKPGDRVVSGTVYMYTESSGSTKEGMEGTE